MLIGTIDIGGSKVAVGVVTEMGAVVNRRTLRTAELGSHEGGLEAISEMLAECVSECGCNLAGIGISCTGPVYPITGTIGRVANLPGWEGCEIVARLASRFKVPVAMENDADAAALAEYKWGAGAGLERFLYITLSTGIGAGLILNGSLYRGANGCHQEVGHHVVDPGGPLCYCGARGCWESMASGVAIAKWYLANSRPERTWDAPFSAQTVFELSEAGDLLAHDAVRRLSYYVGIGLVNLTTILVPDVIALGGGLMQRHDQFMNGAMELWRSTCGEVPLDHTSVVRAALRENLDLAGAAAVLLQAF